MARIGGAFPFPLAQVGEGTARLSLGSGGVWYPPAGEYIFTMDANTQVERWDPTEQVWAIVESATANNGDWVSTDGYNLRLHNITGVISSNTISNAGSGMTNGIGSVATGVSVAWAAAGTTGYPIATGYVVIGGSVGAPTVTQAGSGFLVPPVIVIDPPPQGGVQASAIAVMTQSGSSGIASITMVNAGAGYATTPNFYIIPQPQYYQGGPSGSFAPAALPAPGLVYPTNAIPGQQNTAATGAQLTSVALTGSGTLLALHMVNSGGGYTAAAAVTFTGASGGAAVTSVVATTTLANSSVLIQPRVQ
jgi:hypothetical protein